MPFEERITKEDELVRKYDDVFYDTGLNAVRITGIDE